MIILHEGQGVKAYWQPLTQFPMSQVNLIQYGFWIISLEVFEPGLPIAHDYNYSPPLGLGCNCI